MERERNFCPTCGAKFQWKTTSSHRLFDSASGQPFLRLHQKLICPIYDAQAGCKKFWDALMMTHRNPVDYVYPCDTVSITATKDIELPTGAIR